MNKSKNFNSVLKSTLLFSLLFSIVFLSGCAFTIEELMARADQHYELKTTDDFYTALACANSVIKQSPNNAEAWEMVAMCKILYTNKEFGAVPALKKFAELKGNSSLVNACEGCIIFNEGHMLESAEKFKSAGNLGASWTKDYTANFWVSAYFYRTYGNVLENIGKIDEALEQYKKHRIALSRHEYSGNIKTETDKIVPVIKRLEGLIKAQKSEQNGDLRTALNHYKEAFVVTEKLGIDTKKIQEKIIKLALDLDPPPAAPRETERYVSRGLAAIRMAKSKENYKSALKEFKKALELAPWLPTIYYNMGLVQEQAELYEDAIISFNFYLSSTPRAVDEKVILSKIYELEYIIDRKKATMGQWMGTWIPEEQIIYGWCGPRGDHNLYDCCKWFLKLYESPPESKKIKVKLEITNKYLRSFTFEMTSVDETKLTAFGKVNARNWGEIEISKEGNTYNVNLSRYDDLKNDCKRTWTYKGMINKKK